MRYRNVSTCDTSLEIWVEIDADGEPHEYAERRTRIIQTRIPLIVCNLLYPASNRLESPYSEQNERAGVKTLIMLLFAIFTEDGSITYQTERIDLDGTRE